MGVSTGERPASGDGVVLLHGIFRTHRSMRLLAYDLAHAGRKVLNLRYPSTLLPIEELVETIHPPITSFAHGLPGRLHFVGFSMGGLLARAYLHRHKPTRLGRVVLLGTPNQGSEVANVLQRWWLYRRLYGPAGAQLVTAYHDRVRLFGTIDYEVGVIAGNRSLDPLSSRIIGAPNDGKVSVASTQLPGMKAHIVLPVTHTFMPANRRVRDETLRFLASGTFKRCNLAKP